MRSVIPPGDPDRIRIAGKNQGYRGLAIYFGETTDPNFPGQVFPMMLTAWEPDEAERAAIAAGATVLIQQLGVPPIRPMSVFTGDVPQVRD